MQSPLSSRYEELCQCVDIHFVFVAQFMLGQLDSVLIISQLKALKHSSIARIISNLEGSRPEQNYG
ncbi:hypothetical protein YC2023_067711 [Brassica napus]